MELRIPKDDGFGIILITQDNYNQAIFLHPRSVAKSIWAYMELLMLVQTNTLGSLDRQYRIIHQFGFVRCVCFFLLIFHQKTSNIYRIRFLFLFLFLFRLFFNVEQETKDEKTEWHCYQFIIPAHSTAKNGYVTWNHWSQQISIWRERVATHRTNVSKRIQIIFDIAYTIPLFVFRSLKLWPVWTVVCQDHKEVCFVISEWRKKIRRYRS